MLLQTAVFSRNMVVVSCLSSRYIFAHDAEAAHKITIQTHYETVVSLHSLHANLLLYIVDLLTNEHMTPCDFLDIRRDNLQHICFSVRAHAVRRNSMTFVSDIYVSTNMSATFPSLCMRIETYLSLIHI